MGQQGDSLHRTTFVNCVSRGTFAVLVLASLWGCSRSTPEDSSQVPPTETSTVEDAPAPNQPPASVTASKPEASKFDWGMLTESGDVTDKVRPYFVNQQFDFGTGKITTTKAVKLIKAEIEAGKLVLTMQMTQPKQRVKFDGMKGQLGSYQPFRKPLRPVSIGKDSYEDNFVFAGVLRIGVPHPRPDKILVAAAKVPSASEQFQQALKEHQETNKKIEQERARAAAQRAIAQKSAPKPTPPKPQSLMPGPESGYKPRSLEFAKLAVAVSAMYKMPGRDTFRTSSRAQMDAAQAAAGYPNPDVKKYADKMLERIREDQNIDLNAVRRYFSQQADAIENKIASGAYSRREGSYDYGPTGQAIPVFQTVDESGSARAQAAHLRSVADYSDEKLREYVKQQNNQNSWNDLFFGDGVTNNLGHLFENILIESYKVLTKEAKQAAGPKSNGCLIAMSRPDSATPHLRNTSGKQLTDVVIYLSWGVTRSDKIKKYGHRQFVFIPVWKPGEDVELQKVELKDPSVLHAKVDVYANEASSEEHAFSMVDPKSPPSTAQGTIVIYKRGNFLGIGNPRFEGTAWALIDGKRVEWDNVDRELRVPADPGEHKVVVHVKETRKRSRVVFDGTVAVDSESRESVEAKFFDR